MYLPQITTLKYSEKITVLLLDLHILRLRFTFVLSFVKISQRFPSLDRTRFVMDRQTNEQYVSPRMGQNINMMTDFTYVHMLAETSRTCTCLMRLHVCAHA